MNEPVTHTYDVVVVGAGLSGLGAALELKDRGFKVCLLEKEARPGGRTTTDRIDGFAIDTGTSIFGQDFSAMLAMVERLGLQHLQQWANFSFGLRDANGQIDIRWLRPDVVLFSHRFGLKTKLAMARFSLDVLRNRKKLRHGYSEDALHLDNESVGDYMRRIGGEEFLNKILLPGLNGPLGGVLVSNSKIVLFQAFWNILVLKSWALKGGLDAIAEGIASEVPVITGCAVVRVETGSQCRVTAKIDGEETVFTSRGVVVAVPGTRVAALCPDLPPDVRALVEKTRYSTMSSAHVSLATPPHTAVTGYGVADSFDSGYEIELEHNRVGDMCPPGKGMVSIYFWDDEKSQMSQKSDDEFRQRATAIVDKCFPECDGKILGVHILRWKDGIGQFAP
ncbi:MAG TPA: NAD(P)/FAD-dependent oxidoreductase, partial [Abditibacteriaceae bacterium]